MFNFSSESMRFAFFWSIFESSTNTLKYILRVKNSHIRSIVNNHSREETWTVFIVVLFFFLKDSILLLVSFSRTNECFLYTIRCCFKIKTESLVSVLWTSFCDFIIACCVEFLEVWPPKLFFALVKKGIMKTFLTKVLVKNILTGCV